MIDDATAKTDKVERLVLCSGKLYYELLAKKEELNDEKVALVRLEQLYPLQMDQLDAVFENILMLKNSSGHRKNLKTWGMELYPEKPKRQKSSGNFSGCKWSTCAGSHKKFEINQNAIINQVFQCDGAPAKDQ